jgi:hypothetical protein
MLQLQSELSSSLANVFTKTRSRKLFEMVAEFPDSLPSLRELKQTASATNNMGYLGKVFRATVQRRLLHMGASTSQILVNIRIRQYSHIVFLFLRTQKYYFSVLSVLFSISAGFVCSYDQGLASIGPL